MTFPEGKEAGWHVLIGDNGSGKSTIVRAVAACLVGSNEINTLRVAWHEWLKENSTFGAIMVVTDLAQQRLTISHKKSSIVEPDYAVSFGPIVGYLLTHFPITEFSAAYGPFRRFTGGSKAWDKIGTDYPKASAHLSAFGEDIALTEALDYVRELYVRELDKSNLSEEKIDKFALDGIVQFINRSKLLPHNAQIFSINSESINILVGSYTIVPITQLSDGFRSILSLVLDLLHRLILAFGSAKVFKDVLDGGEKINLPGVVLIDEVDSHLHPTWQDTIGEWFTTYFPNIQFIVTTHSPIICRAAERGSIWRLAAPGSGEQSGEVTGTDRDRLIYGNILDALGTDAFGEGIERSDESQRKLARLTRLNQLYRYGKISEAEKTERDQLSKIFNTDDSFAE